MTKIHSFTLWFDRKTASVKFCQCKFEISVKSSWEVHWIVMFQKDAVCLGWEVYLSVFETYLEMVLWKFAMLKLYIEFQLANFTHTKPRTSAFQCCTITRGYKRKKKVVIGFDFIAIECFAQGLTSKFWWSHTHPHMCDATQC